MKESPGGERKCTLLKTNDKESQQGHIEWKDKFVLECGTDKFEKMKVFENFSCDNMWVSLEILSGIDGL